MPNEVFSDRFHEARKVIGKAVGPHKIGSILDMDERAKRASHAAIGALLAWKHPLARAEFKFLFGEHFPDYLAVLERPDKKNELDELDAMLSEMQAEKNKQNIHFLLTLERERTSRIPLGERKTKEIVTGTIARATEAGIPKATALSMVQSPAYCAIIGMTPNEIGNVISDITQPRREEEERPFLSHYIEARAMMEARTARAKADASTTVDERQRFEEAYHRAAMVASNAELQNYAAHEVLALSNQEVSAEEIQRLKEMDTDARNKETEFERQRKTLRDEIMSLLAAYDEFNPHGRLLPFAVFNALKHRILEKPEVGKKVLTEDLAPLWHGMGGADSRWDGFLKVEARKEYSYEEVVTEYKKMKRQASAGLTKYTARTSADPATAAKAILEKIRRLTGKKRTIAKEILRTMLLHDLHVTRDTLSVYGVSSHLAAAHPKHPLQQKYFGVMAEVFSSCWKNPESEIKSAIELGKKLHNTRKGGLLEPHHLVRLGYSEEDARQISTQANKLT